jgi:autotransporter-associated beta strand protein
MLSNAQKLSGKRNQKIRTARKLNARQMLALAAAAVPFSSLLGQSARATVYTWSGADNNGLWSDFSNWGGSGAPSSTSDTATFTGLGNSTLVIGTGNATVGNVTFTSGAGGYTIGLMPAGTDTLTLNAAGSISVGSSVTGNETFDSTIILGNTAVGGSTATFTNNSAYLLDFASNITGGSGTGNGSETLIVNGSGNTTISGSLLLGGAGNLTENIALTKTGTGTLTFNGTTNAAILGGNASGGAYATVTVNSGKLVLDFSNFGSVGNANLLNSYTPVSLGGGTLQIIGNAGNASTQSFANSSGVSVNAGYNVITVGNASNPLLPTLNLGNFTQTVGAQTVFYGPAYYNGATISGNTTPTANVASTGNITTTTVGTQNKLLRPGNQAAIATVGLYNWASVNTVAGNNSILSGDQVSGFYVQIANNGSVASADTNYDLLGNATGAKLGGSSSFKTDTFLDTLRFNVAGAYTFTTGPTGTNAITEVGGILVTPNVGANNTTIANGGTYLSPGNGGGPVATDVYQNNSAGELVINVPFYNAWNGSNFTTEVGSYVQGGAGTVVLTGQGTNDGQTGATYLNGGDTVINNDAQLGPVATHATVYLNGGTIVAAGNFSTGASRQLTLLGNGGGLAAYSGDTMTITGPIGSAANTGPLVIGIPASAANGNVSGLLPGTGNGTANTTPIYGNGTVVLNYANGANGNFQYGGTTILGGATLNINSQYDLGGTNQGPTTFNNGTLQYATTLATGAAGNVTDISGQLVTFAGNGTIDTNGHAISYANAIGNGGAGSLTVASTAANGSLTLSGANSYTGGTNVTSGRLILANGASLANGAVSVSSGATFSAFGNTTIGSATGGTLTLNSGSNFSLGNGTVSAPAGILNLPYSGATALITAGNMTFYVGGNGTLSDEINVTGNVTSSSLTTIYVVGYGNTAPALSNGNASYVLINAGGISGGNFTLGSGSTITINSVIYNAQLSGNSTDELLNISAVAAADYYWAGGDPNNGAAHPGSWAAYDNFISGPTGNTTQNGPPTIGTNVHETANSYTNGSQTLDGNYTINSLTFNSQSGNITIASGTGTNALTLSAAGNFSDGGSNYLTGIGLVAQSGAGNATISANVVLGTSQTWEIDSANPLTVSGVISNAPLGSNALTKTGAGTLVLSSGSNTYSGGTIISGGAIQLGAANTLLSTGSLQVSGSGSTFDLNGYNQTVGALSDGNVSTGTVTSSSGAATLTVNNSSPNTFSGTISGNLGLTLAGSSSLKLSGANSYIGLTSLNGGILQISAANNLGNASAATNSISFNGGTLESTANAYDLGVNRAVALVGSGTIQVDTGSALTVSGNITGNNTLSVTGGGLLTLSGGNSTFGGLAIANGSSLSITGNVNLPSVAGNPYLEYTAGGNNTSVYVSSGGSLTYGNDGAAGDDPNQALLGNFIQTGGTVNTEESNLAPNGNGTTTMFLGGGNYTSNLGKYGAFTVGTRGLANLYVDGGNLVVNGNSTYPMIVGAEYGTNGGVAPAAGNRIVVQQSGTVTTTGLTLGGLSGGTVNSPGIYYLNGGTLTTSTLNRGYDPSTAYGTGTLIFDGGKFASGAAFATDGNIITNIDSGGATIDTTLGNLTWTGGIAAGTTGNVNGIGTLSGGSGYTTAPTVTITGGGGNGATAVAILNASGNVADVVITNPGSGYTSAPTFAFSGNGGASVTGTIATGNGGLTKVGNNTLTLSGANTYLGPTTVNVGTLAFGAASSFASTAYNVAGGATLDVSALTGGFTVGSGKTLSSTAGSGTTAYVNGNVTVNGGTLGTGVVGSTLQIGNLSLTSGSLKFAINDPTTTTGNSSLVYVPGTLTLTSGSVALLGGNFISGTNYNITYDLFQDGSQIGNATVLSVAAASQLNGLTYTIGQFNNYVTLNISGTPHFGANWITDGNGSWASPTNWDDGVPNQQYAEANFGGAAASDGNLSRTVMLNGNETVGAIKFSSPDGESYTIDQGSGGSLILDNGNTTALISATGSHSIDSTAPIQLNSNLNIAPANSSDSIAIRGVISNGPSGNLSANTGNTYATLTKSGSGTLILSNVNTYGPGAGLVGTYLTSGILQVQGNNSLGAGDAAFNGTGTLQAGAAGLNVGNNLIIGNASTATLDSNGYAFTVSGNISDSSSNGLVVTNSTGTGKVILASLNNTYSGPTTISSGTLAISAASNLGSTSSINFNAGTLESTASGNYTLTNNVALPGAGTIQTDSSSSTLTLNGAVSGTGSLTKTGNGTLVLAASNSYSGVTNVSAGVLDVQNGSALGSVGGNTSALAAAAGTTVASGAALYLDNNVTIGAEMITLNGAGPSGLGALENKSGSNIIGGNGVSNSLFVAAIQLASASTITADAGTSLTINGGVNGAYTLTLGGNGTINIGTINGNVNTEYLYGIDIGAGNLTYAGNSTGVLNLYSANNFNGKTVNITGGTVNAYYGTTSFAGSSLGYTQVTGRTVTVSNATLNLQVSNVFGNPALAVGLYPALSLTSSTLNVGSLNNSYDNNTVGNLTLNGSTVVEQNEGGNFQELGLAGSVTVTGSPSTLESYYSPTYGIPNGISLGMGAPAGNQTLFNVGPTTGTGTAGNATSPDLTVSTFLTNANSNASGNPAVATGLIKAGTGVMTLQYPSTYTGNTTVTAGTLQLADGSSNAISTSPVITIASGATLDVTNDYGQQGESGGKIVLSNSISPGQILGGSGTVKGNLEVASGTTISAGTSTALGTGANAIGTLTTTGSQTWDGGGNYTWKITSSGNLAAATTGGSGAPGTKWDNLVLSALTVNSGTNNPFTISLTTAAATGGAISGTNGEYSWILAQTGSASLPTNITDNQNLLPSGNSSEAGYFVLNTSSFSMNGVTAPSSSLFSLEFEPIGTGGDYDLVLDYAAAPEPGTALLVMGGVVPMLMGRRRRKSKG